MYEEAFFHLLNNLHHRYQMDDLALAGGCAMNSVANGRITRETPFKRVFIQAAAGDAGGAIGAAFALWHQLGGERCFRMDHAFWGPGFSDQDIAALLDRQKSELSEAGCSVERVTDEATLCSRTAKSIAEVLASNISAFLL